VVVMLGSVFKRCGCGCRVAGSSSRLGGGCLRLRCREHGSWYFSLESERAGGRCRVRRGGFVSREAARTALRRARGDEAGAAEPVVWTVAAWL
jgi:hypothetical protein